MFVLDDVCTGPVPYLGMIRANMSVLYQQTPDANEKRYGYKMIHDIDQSPFMCEDTIPKKTDMSFKLGTINFHFIGIMQHCCIMPFTSHNYTRAHWKPAITHSHSH